MRNIFGSLCQWFLDQISTSIRVHQESLSTGQPVAWAKFGHLFTLTATVSFGIWVNIYFLQVQKVYICIRFAVQPSMTLFSVNYSMCSLTEWHLLVIELLGCKCDSQLGKKLTRASSSIPYVISWVICKKGTGRKTPSLSAVWVGVKKASGEDGVKSGLLLGRCQVNSCT